MGKKRTNIELSIQARIKLDLKYADDYQIYISFEDNTCLAAVADTSLFPIYEHTNTHIYIYDDLRLSPSHVSEEPSST